VKSLLGHRFPRPMPRLRLNPQQNGTRLARSIRGPKPQLIQVIEADVAVVHALDQMITNRSGEP
jgi:hypothetical protein